MKHIPSSTVLPAFTRVSVEVGTGFIGEVISGELRQTSTGAKEAIHKIKLLKKWVPEDYKYQRLKPEKQIVREFNHKVIGC